MVYKADDTKLRRAVALKFLTPDKTRDEQAKKRFMHEAQAASALDHPNIAVVHEIDETDDGSSFICMAYYPGQTLKEKIEAGPLPLDEVIDITLQITNGLQRAHEAGIVHRDIKPANIILTERGEVKIVDFGIAKLVNQTKTTDRGSKAGTALYMSPEQITGSPVDQRSDLFSVGVVLYEMVTGKRPFTGEHEPALFYSILNVEPTPPSELRSAVPALLESIVLKLLQKEPANRYEHAIELRADLMRVVGKEPQEQRKRKPFEFIKVRQPIVALISFALLVIVGVMYFVGPLSKTDRLARTSVSEKLTLAVLYFENQTNDRELDWLSKGIADMLIADLSRSQYLHLISMDRLYNIFQIVAEGTTDQNERSRALEIANRARAQIVITGSFLKSGEAIRIVAQVYDLRSDRLLPTPKIEGKGIASVFEMVDELSASIKLALEIKATGEEGAAEGIRRTKTRSVDAYKYFILGQDAARSSLYEDAIANVRKAIALDSTFAHAYRLLGYVYDAIGEEEL
ncbi:MAG: protein kinase domain-containing protein, partial [Bacteroidota bacterium]